MTKGKKLRIVFMGTPDFAVESLKKLNEEGYNIAGVITAPDRPAGRGKHLKESAVKEYALANNLKVLQPEKLKNPNFLKELRALQADLQVVVAFRMLPEVVWNMPPLGTFNLHGSLLPQYRGAAPLNWAIINGETKTGVTTFLLNHEIDTGKILFRKEIDIQTNDTVETIHNKLMAIGANLVTETVETLASGNYTAIAQDTSTPLKHAPKIFKDDCRINWGNNTQSIRNLVRGLSPYPAAWTTLINVENAKTISAKIFFTTYTDCREIATPGTIKSNQTSFLDVACNNGWLRITDLQLAGKKRMKIEDFLRGFQQINDYKFQ